MKIEVESSDIHRGAMFVSSDGAKLMVVHAHSCGNALVNLTQARIAAISSEAVAVSIASTLVSMGAVPLWLHEAREAERKRVADLAD